VLIDWYFGLPRVYWKDNDLSTFEDSELQQGLPE
jgi:hypothetical protein